MKRKINAKTLVTAVLPVLLTLATAALAFGEIWGRQVQFDLARDAALVAAAYARAEDVETLAQFNGAGVRVTLVAPDGSVLFDNRADTAAMENHLSREEIGAALASGTGQVTRVSQSLGAHAYYYAQRMPDGNVLRVSVASADANAPLYHALPWLALVAVTLLAFALFVALSDRARSRPAEALSEEKNEQAENERIRKDFTANVSHELKTPLTSISGYAEMIKTGIAKEEDIKEFAGKIHAEAGRMITLIGDIIQLSELDDPHALLEMAQVDLTDLARSTAELLAFQAEKQDVSIEVEGERCPVLGNRGLLEELIYNLCDNAIRYNKPGGRVTVRVSRDGAHVNLWVSDTGIGIPPEHQARVFERFYRVDKSRSKETGGTGLGLAIVKHIAEQHNAAIRVESREGEGTTVKVTFSAP